MVSIAVMKHPDQMSTWGGNDLIQFVVLRSHKITEGSQGRELRQKLVQKQWSNAAY